MDNPGKKKRTLLQKLQSKYRLVIFNDETYEEAASFRLSRMNVYVAFSSIFVLTVAATFALIIFTPLKEYLPGYADVNMRKDIIDMTLRADSLEQVVGRQELWIANVSRLLSGKEDTAELPVIAVQSALDSIDLAYVPKTDIALREEIERESDFQLTFFDEGSNTGKRLNSINFYAPVKGVVSQEFNPQAGHYGVDLVASIEEAVKATLDGTVVFSDWTLETGYVIGIQHESNLFSIYKHNSVLLKKTGSFVSAGDVIAVIGSSGELTSGQHLHFEIWHNGFPLNPTDFLMF